MSDLISRADAIEAIQNAYCKPCKERGDDYNEIRCRACEYDSAIIQIDALPSADTSSDLISRANAIRWVKTECNQYGKPTLDYDSGLKVIEHLKKMPSELPSTEAEWIPVSKRLPKEKQEVYVTVYFIEGDTGRAYGYMDGFGRWHLYSAVEGTLNSGYEVIAWMPLPKPYKGGDDE